MTKPEAKSSPTTVLVVDDEDGIRHALDRFLTRLGYRVLQATSGAEALERQAVDSPDVMLSDIRMPNMSGVELVPKALAQDADLAVIMLTAIDEPRTAIECLKLGAYDYLIKPVDLEELEMSLQGALRQRQLEIDRRELEHWLAREVAVRTRDLEERTEVIVDVALNALAATQGWDGETEAVRRLAKELGLERDAVAKDVRVRLPPWKRKARSMCCRSTSSSVSAKWRRSAPLPPLPPLPPPPLRSSGGRCSGPRAGAPRARSIARSMTLRISRTLPGQAAD